MTFLYLDKMLKKENVTMVYDYSIVHDTHGTGDHGGSHITIIENTYEDEYTLLIAGKSDRTSDRGLYLVGMRAKGTTSTKNEQGKKITVKFNKIKHADGYELQYSTNKEFRSAKKKKVSETKITIKKLKKGKTYYVRIRPYKK